MLYRTLDPRRTLEALHQPSFRWWLVERMVGASTWAMRAVGRGWLVYSLTGSVLALAWVEAVRYIIGILVSPFAGVVSDRIEKRLVMFGCRFLLIFTNLTLALLLLFGVIELWHIVAVTVAEALIYTVMEPALLSIMPEIVGRELLLSATSTTFVVEGILNIVGAAVAGVVIAAVGPGWVFLANAPLFALGATALWKMARTSVAAGAGSMWADFAAGVRYLRASPILLALLALAFARLLYAQPFNSFLAAFSRNDLGFDAAGLGLLTSVSGVGALASSVIIASLGDTPGKGKLLLASGAGAALMIALLMASGPLAPFLFVLMAGAFANAAEIFTRTLTQITCDAAYRGRVNSVAQVFINLLSLSVLPAGVLADVYGVPLIVGSLAVLVLLAHIAAAAFMPALRKLA